MINLPFHYAIFISVSYLSISHSFGQCASFHFDALGTSDAMCRTSSIQSGNGVVYTNATGGSPSYSYLWTNLQTGSTTTNQTWGGLNPGEYKIEVQDQIGCVLIDTIQVDSINPVASFNINSADLDGTLTGAAPVNVEFQNTSTGCAWIGDPLNDDPIYWKLGNSATYQISYDVYMPVTATFNSESVQEICLAISNPNGCLDTACTQITIQGFAGVSSAKFADDFKIYPSPAENVIYLNDLLSDDIEVIIYTANGRQVLRKNLQQEHIIDVSSLQAGFYVLLVFEEERVFSTNFIKK